MFTRRKRSLAAAWRAIHLIERNQMSQQEQVDAVTAGLAAVGGKLTEAEATLQAELNTLKSEIAAGNPPNLSGLEAAASALTPEVEAVAALKPA